MFTQLSYRALSDMQKKAGISFPTQLPIYHSPPDKNKLQAWIENHNSFPQVKNIAKKLASHINYIPFETLLAQLQCMITEFNSFNLPYILWIPQRDSIVNEGCSDLWIAGLCFEFCKLNHPVAIAFTNQLCDVLKQHPTVHHILILDDASYSANHIKNEIQQFRRMGGRLLENHTLYIGIPFMTTHAVSEIKKLFQNAPKTMTKLLHYTNILMMSEVLNSEEKLYLENEFSYQLGSRTLTYFDHRYPDQFSSLWCFEDGSHLLRTSIFRVRERLPINEQDDDNLERLLPSSEPMVPKIISPYRLHQNHKLDELKIAINDKAVGHRTEYPIHPAMNKLMRAKGINFWDTADADVVEHSSKTSSLSIKPLPAFFKPKQTLVMLGALSLFLIPNHFFLQNQIISNLQLSFLFVVAFLAPFMLENINPKAQKKLFS